jgi:N-acetylmuramoyl-L-alanine amidase
MTHPGARIMRLLVEGAVLAAAPDLGWAQQAASSVGSDLGRLRVLVEAPGARDAIARVTLAEAAGQGDSGLAAVIHTILNRLASRAWGDSVDQVVNARRQFEPVTRAGGDWRGLPAARPSERARIDTILNLALEGRLPDLTGGALYFQNPRIVAARAAAGTVSARLVNFGGATPSVVIGDHAFYVGQAPAAAAPPTDRVPQAGGSIFPNESQSIGAADVAGSGPSDAALHPGARGLFVLPDGRIVEDPARTQPPPR